MQLGAIHGVLSGEDISHSGMEICNDFVLFRG